MWRFSRFTSLIAIGAAVAAGAPHAGEHQHVQEQHGQEQTRYSRSIESYTMPEATLIDMTGSAVTLASALDNKGPLFLQFIFTTCSTICPVMSGTFAAAQDKLGTELDGVRMVSISIDPEYDTPARLREYATKFKARRQWRFLTGATEDIIAVEEAFNVYQGSKMRHRPVTFLRAAPDRPWVRLDGLMSAAELVAEYHRLAGH